MKKLLLSLLIFTAIVANAQTQSQNNACQNAISLCGSLGVPFSNTTNSPIDPGTASGYGCLNTQPNPAWFYLPVAQAGNLAFKIMQTGTTGNALDVDFILWGPFANAQVCSPANLNPTTRVGCSFSPAAVETFTIPNAQPGQYYILMVTNFSNQNGSITITETHGNTGALDCSGLRLAAFIDANGNGQQDAGETPFPAGEFTYEKNNDGTLHNVANVTGFHAIYDEVLTNTYDVSLTLPSIMQPYISVSPASFSNILVQTASNIVTQKFPVTVTQPFDDLAVYAIAQTQPQSGFNYKNYIVYRNNGIVPANGTVTFVKPSYITITDISQAGTTTTPTGFTYNFTNLLPFETRVIIVTTNIPPIPAVQLGQTIVTSATISGGVNDIDITNNTSVISEDVIGSYDPNDKAEAHGGRIQHDQFTASDYLYYTIRFQNTGTAPAINVRIEDVLDSQLNPSTFEMLRASHNFTVDRVGNNLTWRFNNIMLPHESQNEPASHGYIYFRIKPQPGFEVGDVIPNTAGIYFDFNPVIITNTVTTEFHMPLSTEKFDDGSFVMHPNPARQTVTISAPAGGQSLKQIRVMDVTGKTLLSKENIDGMNSQLNVSTLSTDMYFVEITGSNAKAIKKLIIE